jgi:hypothetical protein
LPPEKRRKKKEERRREERRKKKEKLIIERRRKKEGKTMKGRQYFEWIKCTKHKSDEKKNRIEIHGTK